MARASVPIRGVAALGAGLTLLVGCGGAERPAPAPPGERTAPAPRGASAEERVVRGWNAAVRATDFERAGSYFAPRAIIEQGGAAVRLPSRRAAIAFSAGLPCRARVTGVRAERRSTLATFALSDGEAQRCSGRARVRFVIRDGKIREWRQLPEPGQVPPPGGPPPGEPAPGESAA